MSRIILCDFDGTITTQDTLVKILDTFAGPAWHRIENKIQREEFGNRIGLRDEFALCNPTKIEIVNLLMEEVEIDPTFKTFLQFCDREGYKFVILSGGFSLCIETILKKYNLSGIPYYANELRFQDDRLVIEYPYSVEECKECGNCKTAHLRRFKSQDPFQEQSPLQQFQLRQQNFIIYIGDSTTDRCPGRYANLLFAKGKLQTYCQQKGIFHIPFQNFSEVQTYLMEDLALEQAYVENIE